MRKLLTSIVIGLIAGIIDIIPMIVQNLDWYANVSALVHWIILGIIISYVSFDMRGWLKGLIIAILSSLPITILVLKDDPKNVIPITIMSIILGSAVGIAGDRFAK